MNADDFGMSPAISRGILRAHRDGIVTSTSLLGNCTDLDGARALLAEAPNLGVGVHLALVGGGPVADPARVPSLLTPSGAFLSRGAEFIAAWTKQRIDPADVEREFDAQVARVRAAGIVGSITWTRITTWVSSRSWAGRSRRSATPARHRRASAAPIETPTLSWVTDPRRGLKAGVLTGLGWLTRRQLGARRHSAAELGLRRIGTSRRGARAGDHRAAGPGHARAHLPPGRGAVAAVYDHARRAGGADVGEGAARARPARRVACADGETCFERRRGQQAGRPARAAARAVRRPADERWPS